MKKNPPQKNGESLFNAIEFQINDKSCISWIQFELSHLKVIHLAQEMKILDW